MRYTIIFVFFSAWLVLLAVLLGDWGWLLLWPALSFALLASAYAGLGHRIFGKRPDGRLAWWALLVLLPVLLLLWGLWHLHRRLTREAVCHEVSPGLWLGRRAFVHELPPGIKVVVDLTAEFPAPSRIRQGRHYFSLPTLDASVPDAESFHRVLDSIAASGDSIYLHCAAGHGRSALLAAAVLLQRGLAADVRQAEQRLRQVRPGVRLNQAQRRFLREWFEKLFPPAE